MSIPVIQVQAKDLKPGQEVWCEGMDDCRPNRFLKILSVGVPSKGGNLYVDVRLQLEVGSWTLEWPADDMCLVKVT